MMRSGADASLYDDEHDAYRESVRAHIARTVAPAYALWEEGQRIPAEALAAAAEHGYVGVSLSEEAGGLGLDDPRFPAIVAQEAMRAGAHGYALVLLSLDAALRCYHRADRLASVLTSALDAHLTAAPNGGG
jgi:alkylation response protein AidB-like acyl-CoA dehydrogenase